MAWSSYYVSDACCLQVPTVDVGAVVEHRVDAGAVPRVPDADRVVPRARDEQIRDLCAPQQAAHWRSVPVQHHDARVLRVVPHSDRAVSVNEGRWGCDEMGKYCAYSGNRTHVSCIAGQGTNYYIT